MQIQPGRRSSLFLLELIISILFFSLASAVCVRFFVKSHTIEEESMTLNHAVNVCTSAAEIIRSQDNLSKALETMFPSGTKDGNTYTIYYDKNWQPCTSADSVYTLSIVIETKDSLLTGQIDAYDFQDTIYELEIKKYLSSKEY